MNPRRQAEIEEMFDTVPAGQFAAERKLRAAQAEIARLRLALTAIADMGTARDVYHASDLYLVARESAKNALAAVAGGGK